MVNHYYAFILFFSCYSLYGMNAHPILDLAELDLSSAKGFKLKSIEERLFASKQDFELICSKKSKCVIPRACIICIALIKDEEEYVKKYFKTFLDLIDKPLFHGHFKEKHSSALSKLTPLTLACANYSYLSVKELIKLGAQVNISDDSFNKLSPLIAACNSPERTNDTNRYKIIKLLKKYGAELEKFDDAGKTPLDYIVELNPEKETITVDIKAFYFLTSCEFDQRLAQAYGTFAKRREYKTLYSIFYAENPELHLSSK